MSEEPEKYADVLVDWLVDLGYSHCFFVAGGNIMHLLDGMRSRLTCVATVHEVAAGIAAEYFNASQPDRKALALVTAGPGLTNIVTGVAGAWLESRELLVVGGQVKSTDLARGEVRQRGIQEVDGRDIVAPICVESVTLVRPEPRSEIERLVRAGEGPRPGPVFLEVCLDVQGAPVIRGDLERDQRPGPLTLPPASAAELAQLDALLDGARRPVLLIGGGVSRAAAREAGVRLRALGLPTMTTWNGIDRVAADEPHYLGRPNTWGQRSANVLLQQADLLIALGTRLGLQQTGFNWQQFVPIGRVVQVDVDRAELAKGHPRVDLPICADADHVLGHLAAGRWDGWPEWLAFGRRVRELLPLSDPANTHADGYLDPYDWTLELAEVCRPEDVVIPCSSGGAETVTMQAFAQKDGQVIVNDKGLASMGYGLSGAIGAAFAHPGRRTVHIEGDGGFAQNLQELATVAVNHLNLKMFLVANEGYASIRMTQRNYFDGQYLGCDTRSGLGFPDWSMLFGAYGIPLLTLGAGWRDDERFRALFDGPGPAAFVVPVDPEQTYYPKISSRVTASGSMESAPLHLMTPDLSDELVAEVLVHLTPSA